MSDLSIQRVQPHLPAAATGLLALLIGIQAALMVRDLLPQPQSTPPPAMIESTPPAAPSAPQSMDLQVILNAHLFGEGQGDGRVMADPADAPKTQLSLVLSGAIAVEDPQKGIGLIGETATNARVYAVGEAVAGSGARLHAVYPDRVILDRNGLLEALYLPRKFGGAAPPPVRDPQAGTALAGRVQQMINRDPGTIAEVMRPQPVFAGGRQRGYRVYPGRNRDQFARLGLAPGDLILSINGTPLDDPARGMEIFRTLGSASQVTVALERGGRQQQLALDMTQLANQAAELAPPGEDSPQTDAVPQNPESQ